MDDGYNFFSSWCKKLIWVERRTYFDLRGPLVLFHLVFDSGMIQDDDPAAALLSQTEGITMMMRCLLA